MPASSKPTKVILCTYQVGFGDCFLLTFQYARGEQKHVLIDFGTTGTPQGNNKQLLIAVAKDIQKRCAGKLAAVVATHRHRDHIDGFSTEGKESPGKIIRSLNPDLVVQPWTEEPDAAVNATGPAGDGVLGFLASLDSMQRFSELMLHEAKRLGGSAGELSFIGQDNLANRSAVENLQTMGKNVYVHFGSDSGLEEVLPGVKVRVLGPPSIKQHDAVRKERSTDPNEFWQLQADFWRLQAAAPGLAGPSPAPLFPGAVSGKDLPLETRWFVRQAGEVRSEQLLGLVRIMDDAMNNTSVILLFEAGGKRLLFSGDAQIENWEYALERPKCRALLKTVDLYKVGHHGSRNATPKTLWNLFEHRSESAKGRLKTVVSTMADKHGSEGAHTEVPRTTLVQALQKESDYFSTQELTDPKVIAHEITMNLNR